jgi:hypothetical protein
MRLQGATLSEPDLKISLIRFLGSGSFYRAVNQSGDTPIGA